MRQSSLPAALCALAAGALWSAAPAHAGQLLIFDKHGVRSYEEPALRAHRPTRRPLEPARLRAHALHGSAKPGSAGRTVKRAISESASRGEISRATATGT